MANALAFLQAGDCLLIWKLDRLGQSLRHFLATVNDLKARGIAFRPLTWPAHSGEWFSKCSPAVGTTRRARMRILWVQRASGAWPAFSAT